MSHYFENDSNVKSIEKLIDVKIKNDTLKFYVDNGIFSKNKLDYGTRLLLESINISDLKGDILDFGCGYGPIGIYIAKKTNLKIDMIDINKRALNLANKNSKINNVNTNIFESNIYSNVVKKYDYIISNPPIRVGKEILYKILLGAKEFLKSNGQLWIVINKDQGAKTVSKELEKYYSVEIVEKSKGFYIICASNY